MTQTITRLFDDYADATNAIRELEAIGVPHDHLSIVASNADKRHGEHVDQDHDGVNDHGDVSRGVSTGAVLGGAGDSACSPFRVSARSSRPAGWRRPPRVPASVRQVARRPAASSAR
jgi:hypothetical protein